MLRDVTTIKGDTQKYAVNKNIKKYTLIDMGFSQTKLKNYVLERSLDPMNPYTALKKLKIVISSDFKKLDMSTTDATGLHTIDIFGKKGDEIAQEQYKFLIKNLLDREVLQVED